NSSGDELWTFDTELEIYSSAAFGDLDNDGDLEVIIGDLNSTIYCLAITGTTEYGDMPWSSFHGSAFNTGQMDSDSDYIDDQTEDYFGTSATNVDSDGDTLEDWDEIHYYGTDPTDTDTENDGMPDGYEIAQSFNPLVDDSGDDADSDTLFNVEEYNNNTDPHDPDTDNDGLSDGAEVKIFDTNPLLTDTDSDGIDDLEELTLGTDGYISDPTLTDTDSDGLGDFDEVNTHDTNPSSADTDGDGLDDFEEVNAGADGFVTDPNDVDTDGDTYSDFVEVSLGSDPTDDSDIPDITETPPPTTTITIPGENITITEEGGIIVAVSIVTFTIALTFAVVVIRRKRLV
ncbi:MAG: hypothetical protein ACTSQK_10975, partial [Candidatus Heimdallarchaeota archaeon]